MAIRRREFLVGTGAVMTTSLFVEACGRASSAARPVARSEAADTPIIEALRYGVTAPSAHNTQPWLLELVSGTEARLFADPDRLLPHTDPPTRQVHISHGTFLEVTAVAATHFGHRAEIELLPDGPIALEELGKKPTAHIRLVRAPGVEEDALFRHVLARRTSRLPHEGPMLAEEELAAIVAEARPGDLRMELIPEAALPRALEIVREAMAIEVSDHALYDETRKWFRFSRRALRQHRDGLSVNTAGLRGFPAGMANTFLTSRNFHKPKNRERFLETFGETVESSRGLLTITSPRNTMQDWLTAGRVFVRAQLAAEELGLRFHPVSQVLQEYPQMDALRSAFEVLVDAESPAKVQMLARVGRTETPGLSPRRNLVDLLVENREAT